MIQILEVIFDELIDFSITQNLENPVFVTFGLKIQQNSAVFQMIQILEVVFDKIIDFSTTQNLEKPRKSEFYTIFAKYEK